MKILFATHNANKVREIASLLGDNFELVGLAEAGVTDEIPETQLTIEGNALQKAREANRITGIACFADDTGLEVAALGGKPGVFSARYAGEEKNPDANMQKLLGELEDAGDRRARFKTVMAWVDGSEEAIFEGIAEGIIIKEKRGEKGFGYDPIFVPFGETRTFAEMELHEKNTHSHRAKALELLLKFLKEKK